MHDIEPYYQWRDRYIAAEDAQTPFYGRQYSEFEYSNKVYNYFIHPQWDEFGSNTLYTKLLYTDYEEGYAIFEMIGEWNDSLYNDIMFFKREVVDELLAAGIYHYILICENVLNYHGDENAYYEEWYEEVSDEGGWFCFVNLHQHVEDEMLDTHLHHYAHFGHRLNGVKWRPHKPAQIFEAVNALIMSGSNRLT